MITAALKRRRRRRALLASLAVLVPALTAAAGCRGGAVAEPETTVATEAPDPNAVVARIDGIEVTLADLDEMIGAQLGQMEFQYRSQRHELVETTTRQFVRRRLLEEEAADRGISADELVAELQAGKIDVSDEEIRSFYEQNRAQLAPRTIDQLYIQIRQYLEEQLRESLMEEFAAELAADRDVDYLLGPFRVELDVAGAPSIGPEDAPVTMVEFSDFECPYCRSFAPTIEQIRNSYPDAVRIVFLQFPLQQIHPNATKAAEASLCAHEQDKFWETHDLYFAEQEALTVADLKEKATRLGLETSAFETCLDSGRYADRVAADQRAGIAAGVTGTPAVFVNGRPLRGGAVPYEMVAEIIDDEIERGRR